MSVRRLPARAMATLEFDSRYRVKATIEFTTGATPGT